MPHSVYVVACADATLYTGSAHNVFARIHEHNTTKAGAKYTRARRPVKLVYSKILPNRKAALKREAKIKQLTRKQKLQLIRNTPD